MTFIKQRLLFKNSRTETGGNTDKKISDFGDGLLLKEIRVVLTDNRHVAMISYLAMISLDPDLCDLVGVHHPPPHTTTTPPNHSNLGQQDMNTEK